MSRGRNFYNTEQAPTPMQSKLERHIRKLRKDRDLLFMSHCVLGYKTPEDNHALVQALVDANVEIIELQFPFSEPIADGPILLTANHDAVASGISTDQCFSLAGEICNRHPNTAFVIMTYYNVVFCRGVTRFMEEARDAGVLGIIVPDLPIEEADELLAAAKETGVSPILLVTPTSSKERLKAITERASGLLYCVARKGVTGRQTLFSKEFDTYLDRVKEQTDLPLGVGFGVKTAEDVQHLNNRADVAIVCSQIIEAYAKDGPEAAGALVQALRKN